MNKIDMIKAFAKLEGIKLCDEVNMLGSFVTNSAPYMSYNPIDDLALNCSARDKYEVNVEYCTDFDCGVDGNGSFDIPYVVCFIKTATVDFVVDTGLGNNHQSFICLAVIECILKSKGLWNE